MLRQGERGTHRLNTYVHTWAPIQQCYSHVTAATLTAVSPVSGRSLQSHLMVAVVADKCFEEGFGPLTQITHPTQQRHLIAKSLRAAYALGPGLAGLEFCPLVSLLATPPSPVSPPGED